MPKLMVMKDGKLLSEWTLDGKELTIGRGGCCHMVLQDALTSWQHAKIVKAYDGYMIEDLGSTNGITINGRQTIKQMLKYGDIVKLGSHELHFDRSTDDHYSTSVEETVKVRAESLASVASSNSPIYQKLRGRPKIHFLNGPNAGLTKPIETAYYTIISGNNLAAINQQDDVYILKHLAGRQTTLNGKQIYGDGAYLKSGDKIQVGDDEIRFLME